MIKRLLTALLIIIGSGAGEVFAGNVTCSKVGVWGTDRYRDVFVQGSYAYCAAEEAGLDIIDVGNPSNPKKIGNFDSLFARRVWVNGNTKHAYLADTDTLKIIDISVPSAPKLTGVYNPNLLVEDVIVNGNYCLYNRLNLFLGLFRERGTAYPGYFESRRPVFPGESG